MSATSFYESSLTKHLVYLQRYAASINNDQADLFASLAKSVRSMLNEDLTSYESARLTVVYRQLDALIDESFDVYSEQVQKELAEFIAIENDFQYSAVQNVMAPSLARVPVERLNALLTTEKMTLVSGKKIKKLTIDEMLTEFSASTKTNSKQKIEELIRVGVAAGDSLDTVSRRVAIEIGESLEQTNNTIRTWSKSNVLTIVNHISQTARNEVTKANSEYLKFEKWSSTLDSRTSYVCQGRDGERYEVGKGYYPPAHFRCRSVRLPYIPDEFAIIKDSERASEFGPVDSRTTYNSWLKRQNVEFQNDVLGEERAELFRSGKVSVKDFTDAAGKTLTLSELREKEGIALN